MTGVATRLVKVVVWDLDGTLWPGVALESDGVPVPYPAALAELDVLAARGIVVSVASRNPAEIGELVERSALAGRFVAAQYGWGRKVDALRRIAAELDVRLDALAFVDDDPMERADVERTLPEVTVLAPDEVADALSWPEFDPGPVTAAGRSRLDSYRQRERRRLARSAFDGSEEDFLRWCALRATLRRASTADQDRLVELARRTTQYNSTGVEFPGGQAVVLSLADRFGDDGLVGLAAVSTPDRREWAADPATASTPNGPRWTADPAGASKQDGPEWTADRAVVSTPDDPESGTEPAAVSTPDGLKSGAGLAAVSTPDGPKSGVDPAAASTPDGPEWAADRPTVSTPDGPAWTADLVAVSCRAGGRGAVPVLLTGVARLARSRGAARLLVPCRLTERNVPVRLGLKQAGFTAAGRAGDVAVYALDLTEVPAYPGWITVTEQL